MDKIGAGIVMWVSLAVAQTPQVAGLGGFPCNFWEDLLVKFGLPTVLTFALLWGWYKRDMRMTARMEQAEDFIREKLLDVTTDAETTKREVASALNKMATATEKLLDRGK